MQKSDLYIYGWTSKSMQNDLIGRKPFVQAIHKYIIFMHFLSNATLKLQNFATTTT